MSWETEGGKPSELHARLAAVPASVAEARRLVGEWCLRSGLRLDQTADVLLALTEATTNAVRHAFPGTGGQFVVDGWVRGPMLILSVCDRAAGLTQLSPARGLGLGRPIITRLAESVDFEDADPGTRVTMRFRRHRHP